jgi:hypothetical protein
LKNKLKKTILILNISSIRLLVTFITFFFIKTLLLHHIDEDATAFLRLFLIEDLTKGRIFFFLIFIFLIMMVFLLKQFHYFFYNKSQIPLNKNLVLSALLIETLVLYTIIILYFENYIKFIILTKIVLIIIDKYLLKLNKSFFVRGGLTILTVFTFFNQLFSENIFFIIILFIFLRAIFKNLSLIIESFKRSKQMNFNQITN